MSTRVTDEQVVPCSDVGAELRRCRGVEGRIDPASLREMSPFLAPRAQDVVPERARCRTARFCSSCTGSRLALSGQCRAPTTGRRGSAGKVRARHVGARAAIIP